MFQVHLKRETTFFHVQLTMIYSFPSGPQHTTTVCWWTEVNLTRDNSLVPSVGHTATLHTVLVPLYRETVCLNHSALMERRLTSQLVQYKERGTTGLLWSHSSSVLVFHWYETVRWRSTQRDLCVQKTTLPYHEKNNVKVFLCFFLKQTSVVLYIYLTRHKTEPGCSRDTV